MLFHKKKAKTKTGEMYNKCNHDISDDNNTLQIIPKIKMVYPMKYNYFCVECDKIFEYTQEELADLGIKM